RLRGIDQEEQRAHLAAKVPEALNDLAMPFLSSGEASSHFVILVTAALQRLLQLLQYCRILERRNVLRDLLALRDRAQQSPHDLPRTCLRQIVTEANILGLRDRTDFLADPVAQLFGDFFSVRAGRPRLLQYDERADGFASHLVRPAHDRRFGYHRIRDAC